MSHHTPSRKRMPRTRAGYNQSFAVGGAEFYLTANTNADGELGEVFAKFGKVGNTLGGLMDMISIAVSVGLQYGVPLEVFVEKFMAMQFEPHGTTDDPDIREATSIGDYLARRLGLDFLPEETRRKLGIFTSAEHAEKMTADSYRRAPVAG